MYKVFKTKGNNHYLYDSVSNNFFRMRPSDLETLKSEGDTSELSACGVDLGDIPCLQEYSPKVNEFETPELVTLELTQQCNLRCDYCYYSGAYKYERTHNDKTMPTSIIDKIIKDYFANAQTPTQYLGFYGGEPLLQFGKIKYAVESLSKLGFQPIFSMTTNGILFTDEIIDFCIEHGFMLTISFDGKDHDKHRKTQQGSPTANRIIEIMEKFKAREYEYFIKNIRTTVTLSPPYNLYENAVYMNAHPIFSLLQMNVSGLNTQENSFKDKNDMTRQAEVFNRDLDLLADEYIETHTGKPFHRALFEKYMLRLEARDMNLQSKAYPLGQCSIGDHRLFITADGYKHMCERVGAYGELGHINDGTKQIDKYRAVYDEYKKAIDGVCESCLLLRLCDYCISAIRQNDRLSDKSEMQKLCAEQKKWYDLIFYIFLSKKESAL